MSNMNVSAVTGKTVWFNSINDTDFSISRSWDDIRFNADMSYFANNCRNLILNLDTISQSAYVKVTDMGGAYYYCTNLTGSPVCGDNVTNMSQTYYYCNNLTDSPVCGNKVGSMYCTYYNCSKLTGNPVCGDNVTNMSQTYYNCSKLTGNPVCGNLVTNMTSTYRYCTNLTGNPVCGNKVTSMYYTYCNCTNLTGNPVCGDLVTGMANTYRECTNLTGSPVCGNKVGSMYCTYYNCNKLSGNMFMQSNNVANVNNMLYGTNAHRINIWVRGGTTTNSAIYSNKPSSLITSWSTSTNCYYDATQNIYVYYNWNGVMW